MASGENKSSIRFRRVDQIDHAFHCSIRRETFVVKDQRANHQVALLRQRLEQTADEPLRLGIHLFPESNAFGCRVYADVSICVEQRQIDESSASYIEHGVY